MTSPASAERCARCRQPVPLIARRCPACGETIQVDARRVTLYFAVAGIVCILLIVLLAFSLHPPAVDTGNTPAGQATPPPSRPAKKPPLD